MRLHLISRLRRQLLLKSTSYGRPQGEACRFSHYFLSLLKPIKYNLSLYIIVGHYNLLINKIFYSTCGRGHPANINLTDRTDHQGHRSLHYWSIKYTDISPILQIGAKRPLIIHYSLFIIHYSLNKVAIHKKTYKLS